MGLNSGGGFKPGLPLMGRAVRAVLQDIGGHGIGYR